jgi:hypothetical protein
VGILGRTKYHQSVGDWFEANLEDENVKFSFDCGGFVFPQPYCGSRAIASTTRDQSSFT